MTDALHCSLGCPNAAAHILQHSSLLRALFTEPGLSAPEHLGLDVFSPPFRSSKSCWVGRKVPPSFVPAWCSPGSSSLDEFWRFLWQCVKVAALIPPYSLMPSAFPPAWEMSRPWVSSFSSSCQAGKGPQQHISPWKIRVQPHQKGPLGSYVTFPWERKPVCHLLPNGVTSRQSWGAPMGTRDKVALVTLYSSCSEDHGIIGKLVLKKTFKIT